MEFTINNKDEFAIAPPVLEFRVAEKPPLLIESSISFAPEKPSVISNDTIFQPIAAESTTQTSCAGSY